MRAETVARWLRWIGGRRRLTCPLGHAMPTHAEINDTGFIRCSHWIAHEKRECDHWIFVLAIRGGGCLVVEVTLDDKAKMRQLSTPAEMLTYLNVFPD